MNINPATSVDVREWCDDTTLPLSKLATVPVLIDPKRWQDWAYTIIQAPKVAQHKPPDPRYFSDWREWAVRFNEAIPL